MNDWNVVVTVKAKAFRAAQELLGTFGEVAKSDFYDVLVMRVDEPLTLLAQLEAAREAGTPGLDALSRVVPVEHAFNFQSAEEFERRAGELAMHWLPELSAKRFHVRMHRRGFKGRLSSQDEERFLDALLLQRLGSAGTHGRMEFDDPDCILAVESVGQRAGMSLWSSEQIARYPLLKLD